MGGAIFVLLLAGSRAVNGGIDASASASRTSNGQTRDRRIPNVGGEPASEVPPENEFLSGLRGQINPLTGAPYDEEQIRRIHYLATTFPQNSLIPRPSKDFAARTADRAAVMDRIAREMTAGTATPERIDAYFDLAERIVRDRVQIAEFVSAESQWPEGVRAEFRSVSDQSKRMLARLSDERNAARAGVGKRRGNTSAPIHHDPPTHPR
jgi:hypothetical protein